MPEKPFEKANKLMKSGARTSVLGAVVFIALTIVSGAMHNTTLMVVFLVLAVLCCIAGFSLTLAGVRRNNADVREIVREAKTEQQRRYNGSETTLLRGESVGPGARRSGDMNL